MGNTVEIAGGDINRQNKKIQKKSFIIFDFRGRVAQVQKQFEVVATSEECCKSLHKINENGSNIVAPRNGSSVSPSRRYKSPEPKILQALELFEAKCVVENPPTLSVRFTKSNKVTFSKLNLGKVC